MSKPGSDLIINLACTGAVPTHAMNPNVPVTHAQIVDEVAMALERGIQIVHLHARDDDEHHSGDPDRYGRLIEDIRRLPGGRDLVICVSTSGRLDNSFEARSRVLMLDGSAKPDMASLTPSSLNFMQSASVTPPETVRRLAALMLEKKIRPELEVFDLGMANMVTRLLAEGFVEPPLYVNVLLGNLASAQSNMLHLSSILDSLPTECIVGVAGLGRYQLHATTMGLLASDAVRIGLEDNLWLDQDRTVPASNARLLDRLISQAELVERALMDRRSVRALLNLMP